jgi:hypothetical protein
MSKQTINIGTKPNDGTGDTLRVAFGKTNNNFTELYTTTQNLSNTSNVTVVFSQSAYNYANTIPVINLGNIYFDNSEIRTTVGGISIINVNEQSWIFDVSGNLIFPDQTVQTGASISITELKTLVANSTSFSDFQVRIAAL